MDFTQRKLTKAEWESIEVPIVPQERRICELIQKGFHDVMTSQNNTVTLIHYCKVTPSADMDQYIYTQYLLPTLQTLAKKHNCVLPPQTTAATAIKIKKADIIRFAYTDKQLVLHKAEIFEYVV